MELDSTKMSEILNIKKYMCLVGVTVQNIQIHYGENILIIDNKVYLGSWGDSEYLYKLIDIDESFIKNNKNIFEEQEI